MALFDWFIGAKGPAGGDVAQSSDAVRAALPGINRPGSPHVIRDGGPEGVDLVAEWRIVDSARYDSFARARVQKANQTHMRFDPAQQEVRALDRERAVIWRNGVPELAATKESGRGQINRTSREVTFVRDSDGGIVKESDESFSTGEFKPLLREAVIGAGWTWRGITPGKL